MAFLVADDKKVHAAIEQQEWLGPLAESVAHAADTAFAATGAARQPIENALNGVWLGHALHPAVVSVPLGAWTTAAVLDVMEATGKTEMAAGADAAVAVGLAGAVGAALTGIAQWYPVQGSIPRKVGMTHALLNSAATILYVGSLAARKSGARGTGRTLGWMGLGISLASAYLGGGLSQSEKMGSDHAPRGEQLPQEFVPVLNAADLPDNHPTAAVAGNTPLLLVKRGESIFCLADACSHYGGPLSEGKLDGDCIVCPWHGSRFRLENGAVADGPATFPQPRLQTRIRDGKIEVRAEPSLPQNKG